MQMVDSEVYICTDRAKVQKIKLMFKCVCLYRKEGERSGNCSGACICFLFTLYCINAFNY